VGEHVLDYLHEVFLHVNTLEDKTQVIKNLDFFRIENFLESVLFSSVGHIHICGEDVVAYPDLMLLIDKLDRMCIKKSIHIKSGKLEKQEDLPDIFTDGQYQLVVESDSFLDTNWLTFVITILTNKKINVAWHFYIKNEKEYEFAESLIEKYDLENTEIKPVYTGENHQFFEYNIYLTEDDLQKPGLNRREVFAHQALNTNDFGKLTILSDGKVYANVYHDPLGTIDDDIRELIYKEMDKGTSWRRIRDMEPCCNCVYQWLCPSPSNYELAIGKPDLCHVKQ
ncbi:MAG: TIGR04150 pseudo-rSAM protein, partial [Ignavibacteria bacterium]|nr:TIGR04150 pseudo-rSAM protein [Ignavibacteria bacterium]